MILSLWPIMRNKKFNFGWLEKRKFAAERKRQLHLGIERYSEKIDKSAETFWKLTTSILDVDTSQNDCLTEFSRSIVGLK
jgi:hypothetical protein